MNRTYDIAENEIDIPRRALFPSQELHLVEKSVEVLKRELAEEGVYLTPRPAGFQCDTQTKSCASIAFLVAISASG